MYFSVTSLADKWMLCSEWVPSEWESKQLILQSTDNPNELQSVNECRVKWKVVFLINKSIIMTF